MEIKKSLEGNHLTLSLVGELNTESAPTFEAVIKSSLIGIKTLTLDMKDLTYLTSAGLRILLVAQKIMKGQGEMKICHVNDDVKEVFFLTGFNNVLNIED